MRTTLRRPARAPANSSPATPRELVARLGRLLLWLAVLVVLIRGLAGIADAQRPASVRPGPSVSETGGAWPDDAARAVAVQFTTAYLTHTRGEDPGEYARRVEGFASPELAGQLAPVSDRGGPAVSVQAPTVAGVVRLDGRRALITVAATLGIGGARATRWLSVPIVRDVGGGLVVDDLPAFVAAPRRASAGPVQGDPLLGPDGGAISDVVTRFVRAYLGGDTGALWYLAAPDARIAASAGGLRLLEVTAIELAAPASARGRLLLVAVRVRDPVGRVVYGLRYRIRLVRSERWYVADINGTAREVER